MKIKWRVECEREHIPVRGNLTCSGDDAADRADEDAVLKRLRNGDIWAWCMVRVSGSAAGVWFSSDWLGGCSYADEDEYRDSGYFEDQCAEVTEQFERLREALNS